MSINLSNINAKNKADMQRKRDEYKSYLMKQAEVNKTIGDKIEAQSRVEALSGEREYVAEMPQYKTTEEELADTTLQRDKALKVLQSFMKPSDASGVLFTLQAAGEVLEFNRFSNQFLNEVKNQKNISPTVFQALWDRFKEKLVVTHNTGISILPEPGEYDAEIAALEAGITGIASEVADVAKKTTAIAASKAKLSVMEKKALYNYAVELAGMDVRELNNEFEYTFAINTDLDISDMQDAVIEIPDEKGTFDQYTIKKLTRGSNTGLWGLQPVTTKKTSISNDAKLRFIVYFYKDAYLDTPIKWTGDPDTVKVPKVVYNMLTSTKSGTGLNDNSTKIKTAFGNGVPIGIQASKQYIDIEKPYEEEDIKDVKKVKKCKRDKKTTNIKKVEFGNYVLNLNALRKGSLHVRYPSGANISNFPKTLISSSLQKILNNIVYEDSFDEDDYDNLDEVEQKLFDDLITRCRIDRKNNVALYNHKKYNSDKRDNDVKRFNLLKGEILAGNDNPELVKELKGLVFKLMCENVLTRHEYNKIMEWFFITDCTA